VPFDDPKLAKKDKQEREFAVGAKLRVKLHDGRIVDITVRALWMMERNYKSISGTRRRRW
jgi:hypothetical protein